MSAAWRGVFPAATTQFAPDESIDLDATLRHLDALLDGGAHGLVLLGTVGENCSLDPAEKIALLEAACAHVKRRAGRPAGRGAIPVLAGVAETTTRGAIRFAEQARSAGVDGLMVLPAMVYKSCPHEAVHHILAVTRAAGLPVMVYNNPVSYGVDIAPAEFAAFANEPLVVAIKESSDDPRRITDLRVLFSDRFLLFCGVDDLVLEAYALGIDGWVSGLVDAFPQENALLWDLLESGAWGAARELYRWYTPLLHLDTLPTLVQCIKLAMAEVGHGSERCRAPRLPLEGAQRDRVLKIIRSAVATRPDLAAVRRAAGLAMDHEMGRV